MSLLKRVAAKRVFVQIDDGRISAERQNQKRQSRNGDIERVAGNCIPCSASDNSLL